jgi:hypothetical protein
VHNTIVINNYGDNNQNYLNKINFGGVNNKKYLRSYAPEIALATNAEFDESTQI